MKNHYEDENVKIQIFFPQKQGKLLANATVSVRTVDYGFYTTKWFAIWQSSRINDRLQEAINITPPVVKIVGFPKITFYEEAEKWYELERLIYSAFLKATSEKKSKDETIKPEDVPL